MDNNKICNPKTEVASGISLNEKDYMNELLSCLKEMEKNYATAMTEASNEVLYNKYKNMFDEISELQRETYEVMFKNGWYCLEKADSNKIMGKYQMLSQEIANLNN